MRQGTWSRHGAWSCGSDVRGALDLRITGEVMPSGAV